MARIKMRLSVLVVSYNTRQMTLDCLRSVFAQTHAVRFEVLVVDNGSTDGSAAAVAAEYPQVRLWALERNLGFAAANNFAARHARGDWILLLNPDTVVRANAIGRLLKFAESKPGAGVVGGRALNADGTLQRNCFLPPSLLNLTFVALGLHRVAPRSRVFGRERMTYWDYASPRQVPVVAGCFMLVRKAAITEVGLLDERFFMYAEEVDWCVRFARAGWEVWYAPDAAITHYGAASTACAPMAMKREARRSLLAYLNKYHSRLYVTLCRLVLALAAAIRAPLHPWQLAAHGATRSGNKPGRSRVEE